MGCVLWINTNRATQAICNFQSRFWPQRESASYLPLLLLSIDMEAVSVSVVIGLNYQLDRIEKNLED